METTYKMIGADGVEYGPVSLQEFKSWIKEGRVVGSSKVMRTGEEAWSTAASYPELGVANRIAAPPAESPVDPAEAAHLEKKIKNGGSWFYWIAGLSFINSVLVLAGSNWGFVAGLSITQIIDYGVREFLTKDFGTAAKVVALVLDVIAAGSFVALGIFACRRQAWPFVVGIVLYGIDSLFTLLTLSVLGILLHGWALVSFVVALKAVQKRKALQKEAAPISLSPRAPEAERQEAA